MAAGYEGPMVWVDVEGGGVILECGSCDYVHVQSEPTPLDERHRDTPILAEGLS